MYLHLFVAHAPGHPPLDSRQCSFVLVLSWPLSIVLMYAFSGMLNFMCTIIFGIGKSLRYYSGDEDGITTRDGHRDLRYEKGIQYRV